MNGSYPAARINTNFMNGFALFVGDFDRKTVLVIGEYPIDQIPFTERNLFVKKVDLESAKRDYEFSRAIIVVDFPSKYNLIKQCFEHLIPDVNNYGISVKFLVHNDKDMREFNMILKNGFSSEYFNYYNQLTTVAENIARNSPGPPEKDIEVAGKISELDDECKLLLRRSFYDCRKIHVEPISGGRDSNHLLKVYAWQENSLVTSSLAPFFVKISTHEKIKKELNNYQYYTDLFIDFKYRPNCRIERCVLTKNYGSLVGNFVDDSIPIRKALEDNSHTEIIHLLFEKSLRGFRRQPYVSKNDPPNGNLKEFIKERIKLSRLLKKEDVISIARSYGLKSDITSLHDTLLSLCKESCKTGPIHGDLHSGNVMVSGQDAILIDFSAIKPQGPLTADPATLEISLCFNTGDKKSPNFESWQKFIDEAYDPNKILRPLELTDQVPDEFSWLRRTVREIRRVLISCDCCKFEIEAILACYLMRIARLEEKDNFELQCHSYALVIAERIIYAIK